MNKELSEQLLGDIREAYGSLNEPNWSFKEKRYREEPYSRLLKKLAEAGPMQETTDLNDDIAVVVFVGDNDDRGVSVWLSLVGKYACFSSVAGVFLGKGAIANDTRMSEIVGLVADEGLVVLSPEELTKNFTFGEGMASVFEILFSRDEAI